MSPIVPVTSAEFGLADLTEIFTYLREAWDMLRSLQFEQKADILRYTETDPGNEALHIAPTKEPVADLDDLDVLVYDVDQEESERLGFRLQEGTIKVFYFYDIIETFGNVLLSDLIRWPATTGDVFKPLRVENCEDEGISVFWTSRLDK